MARQGFDANDLRLRVQASFSASEMRRVLVSFGAEPEDLEGDPSTLSHRLVKVGYKRWGFAELVHKLRAEKPLTEWPDPGSDPDERWAGPQSLRFSAPPGDQTEVDMPAVAGAPPGDRTEVDMPALSGPGSFDLTVHELEIEPAPPPPSSARIPPASAGPSSVGPSSRSPVSQSPASRGLVFAEPAAFRPPPSRTAPSSSIDKRLVIGAVAGVLVLVGVAFGAGLLWQRSNERPTASDESGRTRGPAGRAATVLDESLMRVADDCGLSVSGDPTKTIFALSQEACGREEVQRLSRAKEKQRDDAGQPWTPPPVDDTSDDDAWDVPNPPPRPAARKVPGVARPDPAPQPGGQPGPSGGKTQNCTTRCQGTRSECDRACGPEPHDASLYDAYMNCSSRCVALESKCRRSCI